MKITIAELFAKLDELKAINTYDGDDSIYISAEYILYVDGSHISGINKNDKVFLDCNNLIDFEYTNEAELVKVSIYKELSL